jgi:hypothetical protein
MTELVMKYNTLLRSLAEWTYWSKAHLQINVQRDKPQNSLVVVHLALT